MTEYDGLLLCSGGLDSTTLAYWLCERGNRILPLFIDYGQHCAEREYATLQEVLPPDMSAGVARLSIPSVYGTSGSRMIQEPDLWQDRVDAEDLYLPYRNLMLLSLAAAYAQARSIPTIYAAFINTNHAHEIDCSVEFFEHVGELLADLGHVEISLPFRNYDKQQVAELGLEVGAPIALTFSCQASSSVPCGACPNCVDRNEALAGLAAKAKATKKETGNDLS